MGEDLPAAQIDDRLEGVTEAEAQALATGAAGAGMLLVLLELMGALDWGRWIAG